MLRKFFLRIFEQFRYIYMQKNIKKNFIHFFITNLVLEMGMTLIFFRKKIF